MRILIIILFMFSYFISFSQDKELFEYVNIYREHHNLKKINWSDDLCLISIEQTNKIKNDDSLSHSHKETYENVVMTNALPNSISMEKSFKIFCKEYFKYDYKFDKNISYCELNSISRMYIVFLWHNSDSHKKILLKKGVKIGSCESYVDSNYTIFNNKITVGGVTKTFSKLPSHYKVKIYSTLNMR